MRFFSFPKPNLVIARNQVANFVPRCILVAAGLLVASCGTNYDLPTIGQAESQQAATIFAEEQSANLSGTVSRKSTRELANQYVRVVRRVEPVAESFCRQQTATKAGFNCDVIISVDQEMTQRNAYQSYSNSNEPIVVFSIPLIADARNEDELAFIMGHEFGHHIAEHIKKQEQQAVAGAIAMGVLTAYGQAYNSYSSAYENQQEMDRNIAAGYALGQHAFSQSYELEADVLGTYIAEAAGYDPIKGAKYFARPEPVRTSNGKLSFWGTHPPDEKRLATVIATYNKISQIRGGSGTSN